MSYSPHFLYVHKWTEIIVTKNPEDVKGLTRLKEVSAEAARFYGKQSKLREEATKKLKQEAAKLGATAILLSVDEFAMSPVNNVVMEGTAYK
ncbi:YbjQ family protein [Fusobacterium nucleatum]